MPIDTDAFYANPEGHPLWEEQVNWEAYMLRKGAEQFRQRLGAATENQELTRMAPQRKLLTQWIEPVAQALEAWIKQESGGKRGGPKPLALRYLRDFDPLVASLIATRTILDQMVPQKVSLISIANEIGTSMEHEARMTLWERTNPGLFSSIQELQKRKGSTAVHVRRVNIHEFNKIARKQDLEWDDWSDDARWRIGLQMIDLVVRATRAFEVLPDPTYEKPIKSKKIRSAPLTLQPTAKTRAWLQDALSVAEVSSPHYMPTLVPPRRWSNPRNGGYWTKFVRTPWLIRFKASQETQKRRAIDDFMALDMPVVYAAVNQAQEVGWVVNQKVLAVAQELWARGDGQAGLPLRTSDDLPPKPIDIATNEKARIKWKRMASEVYGKNAKMISRSITANRTIEIAENLGDREFFFPHMLDFRGRMYPIPSALSPQGQDLARGLLKFSKGKPVAEGSDGWIGIELANTWGNDKVGYPARLKFVADNEEMWKRIAKDPYVNREWMTCDQPWQALAAIFELVAYWEHGPGFISNLVVRVDGSCNGLQHLSVMAGDKKVARQVNVLPSDKPKDIYMDVALKVTELLELEAARGKKAADRKMAGKWLTIVDGVMKRAITKRPVMILPYGGTATAYIKYTMAWLYENYDPSWEKKRIIPDPNKKRDAIFLLAAWLAKVLYAAVKEEMGPELRVMKWLQKTATIAAKSGRPLYWTTPVGFMVRHFYGQQKLRLIKTKLDGRAMWLAVWVTQDTLNTKEQASGIAPNFVHSMDAAVLIGCLASAKSCGIEAITTIHDSFGTVAANMGDLSALVRECFIETYSNPILQSFKEACENVSNPQDIPTLPPLPEAEMLDLNAVRESDYFFA